MRQHSDPVIVDDGRVLRPQRIHFADQDILEHQLQELLFAHPELLPVEEIDPAFAPLIPLCRELGTDAGPVDVACVSPDGLITIVETKLWRNPEARREVVAQTIDYASAMQGWSYEEFEKAVRRARGETAQFSLFSHVSSALTGSVDEEALPEAEFVDSVSRCLQRARFLLTIAGDGIRESAERMAGFLASSPQMHYTLALCELACYRLPGEDGMLVVPRTTARTAEVERAVVRIRRADAGTLTVEVGVNVETTTETQSRHRLSENEFYSALAEATDSAAVAAVEQIVASLLAGGVLVHPRAASLVARLNDPAPDINARYSLLVFGRGGNVYSGWLPPQLGAQGLPEEIGNDHYRRLWRVLGFDEEANRAVVRDFGKEPVVSISSLVGIEDELADAVLETVSAIREARGL